MIEIKMLLKQIQEKKEKLFQSQISQQENIETIKDFFKKLDDDVIKNILKKIPLKDQKNEILFCLLFNPTSHYLSSFACDIIDNYEIFAVDGSNTEIDRHLSIPYYFINISNVYINYENKDFSYSTYPFLYIEDEIYREEDDYHTIKGNDSISKERQQKEYQSVFDYIKKSSRKENLSLVLYDGNLIDWTSDRQDIRFGRKPNRFLEDIFSLAQDKNIAICGYVSMPKNSIVSNMYRIYNCKYPKINCRVCDGKIKKDCESYQRIHDVFVFDYLQDGYFTNIFYTLGRAFDEFDNSDITFAYINTGYEIARIEIPVYVAKNRKWAQRCINAIYHQCKLGFGYPIVLTHAHELCTITQSDRVLIERLLYENGGMTKRFSAKKFNKIRRIL